jgi:hypothetical protein
VPIAGEAPADNKDIKISLCRRARTIHPSYLLRIRDDDDKTREYRHFVADLRNAARWLARQAA